MKILYTLIIAILLFSCTPDAFEGIENPVNTEDIKIIELMSDNDKLLANGQSIMEFRIIAYDIKEIKEKYKEQIGDNITYHDSIRIDTFRIPEDQYSKGWIKVYDEQGTVIENNQFKTSNTNSAEIEFYAKVNDLQSNTLSIKIRDVPDENYDELKIPIIFHVLQPPSYNAPATKVTSEVLQEKLDLLNVIYNGQRTTNPNVGHASITFKLAKYDKYGALLKQEGLNIVNIDEEFSVAESLDYMKNNLMWDPNKYLNIWIYDIAQGGWSSDGSKSFKVEQPTVILQGSDNIPGINALEVEDYSLSDITELTDIGIVYNKTDFLRDGKSFGTTYFELSRIMGLYLGLYPMEIDIRTYYDYNLGKWVTINNFIDGDTDFCEDTSPYYFTSSLYKKDANTGNYFTTFNIMANYSRSNSITVDQAKRIRDVLERCPSRWSYKSTWALTGQ